VVHKGDDGVGASIDWRGGGAVVGKRHILSKITGVCCNSWDFFRAVVGEVQVTQLDGGITFGGGCRGETLLLPSASPALDLDRGGGELLRCKVGRDEETGVVVSVNQFDVVNRPCSFFAVLGKFKLHLVGAVCAVAADAVGPTEFAPEEFLAARATERESACAGPLRFLQAAQVVSDCQISRDQNRTVARVGRSWGDYKVLQDWCSDILRSDDGDGLTKFRWNGIIPLVVRFTLTRLIIFVNRDI